MHKPLNRCWNLGGPHVQISISFLRVVTTMVMGRKGRGPGEVRRVTAAAGLGGR